jgi:hypothetical protein
MSDLDANTIRSMIEQFEVGDFQRIDRITKTYTIRLLASVERSLELWFSLLNLKQVYVSLV